MRLELATTLELNPYCALCCFLGNIFRKLTEGQAPYLDLAREPGLAWREAPIKKHKAAILFGCGQDGCFML